MIVTKFPTFLLRSSHSGRKFIEGRAPLASFDGWRGRSTAGPTSLPPDVLSRKHGRYRAVKRRAFLTLLGGAAVVLPAAVGGAESFTTRPILLIVAFHGVAGRALVCCIVC